MSEIWNLSALCRCCHANGALKSLVAPYIHDDGTTEIYAELLRDTFGIHIKLPTIELNCKICECCIDRLRLAHWFKQQVLACDRKFEEYCKNQQIVLTTAIVKCEVQDDVVLGYVSGGLTTAEARSGNIKLEEENDAVHVKSEKDTEATVPPPIYVIKTEDCLEDGAVNSGNLTIKRECKRQTSGEAFNFSPDVKGPVAAVCNVPILYKCEFCVETFPLKRQLDEHQRRSHTGDKPCLCETCSKGFASQDSLKEHVILEHSQTKNNIYVCDFCKKIFARKFRLTEHIKHHTTSKVFVCKSCGREFTILGRLKRHVAAVHEKLRPYKCDSCVKTFAEKQNLDVHLKSCHSEETRFQCEFCNIGFKRMGRLREHLANEHNKRYECQYCNKVFKWNKHLREHVRSHMGQSKVFICEACGRSFNRAHQLKWHVSSVHENRRPFKCGVCDKTFTLKNSLVVHNRAFHTGERRFKCKVCSQRFATEEYLKEHCTRKHSNSFFCNYCQKVFKDKRSLERHINWHKGEGFPCETCGHVFTEQALLKRHVMAVHQKLKPHKCDMCNKAFSRKHTLDSHKRSHTGE